MKFAPKRGSLLAAMVASNRASKSSKYALTRMEKRPNGVSLYEAEQKLRGMERKIRYYKREGSIANTMDLADKKAFCDSKIKEWQGKREAFCKETGLHKDIAREWIGLGGKSNNKVANTGGEGTIQEQKTFNKIDEKRLDLEKVTKEGKEVLAKYASNMEAKLEGNPKNSGWYSHSDNKIYLNIDEVDERDTVLGYTKHTRCLLHELGHYLDWNALGEGKTIHGELKDLRKFIRRDVLNKCNECNTNEHAIQHGGYRTLKDLSRYGATDVHLCIDRDLKNGISDIYRGATLLDSIGNGYGHKKSYWKGDALERETIAHFFEAFASGGKKVEYMKEYLPTAFQYFLDFIKKL